MKKIFFGYTSIQNENVNFALLVIRLFTGLSLAFVHGIGKIPPAEGFINSVSDLGFPIPIFFAWMSGIAEFFGGILVALGFATRPFALLIGVNMGVAAFLAQAGEPFTVKEKALLYLFIALFVYITGAGKYSIDKVLNG